MINIQNEDNECFRKCLVRCLDPVDKNPATIKNIAREFAKQLNFKGIKFPFQKKDYAQIKEQNKISINVFGHGNINSYHIYTLKTNI